MSLNTSNKSSSSNSSTSQITQTVPLKNYLDAKPFHEETNL